MRVNVLLFVDILDVKEVNICRCSIFMRYYFKKNLKGFLDVKVCFFNIFGLGEWIVYF